MEYWGRPGMIPGKGALESLSQKHTKILGTLRTNVLWEVSKVSQDTGDIPG